MKFAVLNQVLIQCELLARFAMESGNDVHFEYSKIVATMKVLIAKNPKLQAALVRHEDAVSRRMRELLDEFKNKEASARTDRAA